MKKMNVGIVDYGRAAIGTRRITKRDRLQFLWQQPLVSTLPTFEKIFRDVRHGLLHNQSAGMRLR